jgi:large subunit ribosomal protein L10
MASIKEYKIKTVDNIKDRLDGARAIVLVDYKGISVEEVNKLRGNFRKEEVDYFISKNTWIKIALNQMGISSLDDYLKGPTAVIVSKKDEVAPARIMKKFKETDLDKKDICSFKVGLVSGNVYQPNQLIQLAEMPSKEELMASVLRGINAPASGIVGVVNGVISQLVRAIDAVAKQKAEQN